MDDCSFNQDRRRLLVAGIGVGTATVTSGLGLFGCGPNIFSDEEIFVDEDGAAGEPAAKTLTEILGLVQPERRRVTVYQAIPLITTRPASPLALLRVNSHTYQVTRDGFVTAIDGRKGSWVFLVNNRFPDRSNRSRLTRLGNIPINSADDARLYVPRFQRGNAEIEQDNRNGRSHPSVAAIFTPGDGKPMLITFWLVA